MQYVQKYQINKLIFGYFVNRFLCKNMVTYRQHLKEMTKGVVQNDSKVQR